MQKPIELPLSRSLKINAEQTAGESGSTQSRVVAVTGQDALEQCAARASRSQFEAALALVSDAVPEGWIRNDPKQSC